LLPPTGWELEFALLTLVLEFEVVVLLELGLVVVDEVAVDEVVVDGVAGDAVLALV
jgi:hypothetical protein